jgi:hypothetical protein
MIEIGWMSEGPEPGFSGVFVWSDKMLAFGAFAGLQAYSRFPSAGKIGTPEKAAFSSIISMA